MDYRRVNARVKRSTYYCRKASDVLAQCSGSIFFSFVDAVTGFNQIANTRRAMEVLAIVARSGKFLPICLTFGPVNGPDDFCYVVDRAYGPGRSQKLRYTKEWVAYVDDLTIRTGRVVDGAFMTDEEHDHEIKEAMRQSPVVVGQPASEALKALGIKPDGLSGQRAKHDEKVSDRNHPTRSRLLGLVRPKMRGWVLVVFVKITRPRSSERVSVLLFGCGVFCERGRFELVTRTFVPQLFGSFASWEIGVPGCFHRVQAVCCEIRSSTVEKCQHLLGAGGACVSRLLRAAMGRGSQKGKGKPAYQRNPRRVWSDLEYPEHRLLIRINIFLCFGIDFFNIQKNQYFILIFLLMFY